MNRTGLVAFREYLENVRTKGFWIGILMMPITLVIAGVMPMLVDSTREAKLFAVIDDADLLPGVETRIRERDLLAFLGSYDEDAVDHVPGYLAAYLPEIRALEEDQQKQLVRVLLNNQPLEIEGLTRRLERFLKDHAASIADWWKNLNATARATLSPDISTNYFVMVPPAGDEESLNQLVQDGELFAYFVLKPDLLQKSTEATYISANFTDKQLQNWFGRLLSAHIRELRLNQSNLDEETARWVSESVEFDEVTIGDEGIREVDVNDVARQWAPVAFVFFLWMAILINTQLLLTNTIEEKSNKLIEVLLSSVSPLELMAGKIIGIAATGLTIIISWALIFLVFFVGIPAMADAELPIDPSSIFGDRTAILLFIMYFVLGYLLYAALLVGLGSLCNNLKDAQNLIMPVQMVQLVPMLLLVPIVQDPNGTLAVVLSWIPPLTPFVMMNRTAGPPTSLEYAGTTLLLVVSIIVAFWFAAKLFRVGILMTGKPPGLRDIISLLRAPVAGYRTAEWNG